MAVTGTRWLLDAGPLTPLAGLVRAQWQWPAGTLHVCGEVAREARCSAGTMITPRQALLDLKTDGMPWVEVHRVALGTKAELYYRSRMAPLLKTRFDAGEAESIALCAADATDMIFVTQDKTALYVAISELGPGRVTLPFDLWRWLHVQGLIDETSFDTLCESTYSALRASLPGIPERVITGR